MRRIEDSFKKFCCKEKARNEVVAGGKMVSDMGEITARPYTNWMVTGDGGSGDPGNKNELLQTSLHVKDRWHLRFTERTWPSLGAPIIHPRRENRLFAHSIGCTGRHSGGRLWKFFSESFTFYLKLEFKVICWNWGCGKVVYVREEKKRLKLSKIVGKRMD